MWNKDQDGSCLLEVLIVILIIGILSSGILISYQGVVVQAELSVCETNCRQLERLYHLHLYMNVYGHSKPAFREFVEEYGESACPSGSEIRYEGGRVWCNVHHPIIDGHDEVSCGTRCLALASSYRLYLDQHSKHHTTTTFVEYIDRYGSVCPDGGVISYYLEQILCCLHPPDSGTAPSL